MKTLIVKVHPSSSRNEIAQSSNPECEWEIYTTSPATDNKANKEIIKLLAKHLRLPKSQILLLKGGKSKLKTMGILDH